VTVAEVLPAVALTLIAAEGLVAAGWATRPASRYRSLFGLPEVAEPIAPAVALPFTAEATWAGVSEGVWESRAAAAPATCGDAMDVPDMVADPVLEA
jgi:hypothetical protein